MRVELEDYEQRILIDSAFKSHKHDTRINTKIYTSFINFKTTIWWYVQSSNLTISILNKMFHFFSTISGVLCLITILVLFIHLKIMYGIVLLGISVIFLMFLYSAHRILTVPGLFCSEKL